MIDDYDVTWFAILWPFGSHPIISLVGLCILAALWTAECKAEDECSSRHCNESVPAIIHNECICVEKAK